MAGKDFTLMWSRGWGKVRRTLGESEMNGVLLYVLKIESGLENLFLDQFLWYIWIKIKSVKYVYLLEM